MKTTDFVATLYEGANNPNKVTVAFTMALTALEKGHSATLILMVDAVYLAYPNATQHINIGEPFKPVEELLETFIADGGIIAVCKSCMVHNRIDEHDIDARFPIITAPEVIDLQMAAKGTMQVS